MSLKIPYNLTVKAEAFPEFSSGIKKVTFVLLDGSEIHEAYLTQGGEILKVGDKSIGSIRELGFNVFQIKDVISEV